MVTNTTIYTRQMYVSLSSDTPDVDFHNGDEIYLIDTRQRIIYDEENSTWYPLPTRGGGGGGIDFSGGYKSTFDQFVAEYGMTTEEITIASDQTSDCTIPHSLGTTPTRCVLYPVYAPTSVGYQLGICTTDIGADNPRNRTYLCEIGDFTSALEMLDKIDKTLYVFARSATATTITLRGGTSRETKLKAGAYILALK